MSKKIIKIIRKWLEEYETETGKLARLNPYHNGRYKILLQLMKEKYPDSKRPTHRIGKAIISHKQQKRKN